MTLAQMTPPFISTLARPESAGTPLAWPPTGRQIADKPAGGFLRCPTDFLTLPWGLYRDGHLPFLGLRTWLGLLELPERRLTSASDQDVHYSLDELCQLLHVPRRVPVQAALRSLEDLGLVAWSESSIRYLPEPAALRERALPGYQALQAQIPAWRTWVPVPRRLVRWLAREGTPGLCATAAGVLLRCLWSKQRQCVSGGRVAARWIAEGFGVAERTVQRALESLQEVGWLARLRSTNAADAASERRYGACTVVNLGWNAPGAPKRESAAEAMAPDRVRREKSRPARREVSVEHRVKHSATLDQNLSPVPPAFDQNLSPTLPVQRPETTEKSIGCGAPSGSDFYPLQEQRPDPVPATRAHGLPTGFFQNEQNKDTTTAEPLIPRLPALMSSSHLLFEDESPTAPTNEAPLATSLPTPPASVSPVLLEDPTVAFAALPPAEQDDLLQAATARLLARGVSAAFLIRPALLAEVYAQLAPPSIAVPGAERREAPAAAPAASLPPSLRDVVPADLRDVTRLEALRQQAIRCGWLTGCAADRLCFVAAAMHARRIGATPCALFVAVVRGKRWELITQEDEDQARALLRECDPGPVRPVAASTRGLSEDARFVRGVQQILRQAGWHDDPFLAITAKYPGWTQARWDAALAELHAPSSGQGLAYLGKVLGVED